MRKSIRALKYLYIALQLNPLTLSTKIEWQALKMAFNAIENKHSQIFFHQKDEK